MIDFQSMLKRQAEWQRARASRMTWTEKLRVALELRRAAVALRQNRNSPAGPPVAR